MNYKYSIHHSRGKSDTNFYNEKSILDGAYTSLKALNGKIVGDIDRRHSNADCFLSKRTKSKTHPKKTANLNGDNRIIFSSDSTSEKNEIILTLLERILLFKKELDIYFFGKLKCVKFHLDNILQIINSEVHDLKSQLIKDCPKLKKCRLIKLLSVFSEVLNSFIETKPQEFYREIKDAIINQWEVNRNKINEFFDKLGQKSSFFKESDSSSSNTNHLSQEYFQFYSNINNDNISNSVKTKLSNISAKLSEDEDSKNEDIILYLLSKKKQINHFLFQLSQGFFFTISKLFYEMDYYSSVISSVTFKILFGIISYFNTNKDSKERISHSILCKQRKIYHIIDHIVNLARTFNQSIKTGEISLENGSFNSMCKFILNNFCEIMPKCEGIKDPEEIKSFKGPTLFQRALRNISYKSYLQRYNRFTDKNLLRIFRLYYNTKLFFWKSIVSFSEEDATTTFCCRICEKKIPLNESSLHINYCKEQKLFYERMNSFKNKFQIYINDLDCYLTKINLNYTTDEQNKKIFGKNGLLHNIICRLPDCKDDENGEIFLKSLIKLYRYEYNKPVDYYENKPEDLSYIISLGYFTLVLFLFCKLSNANCQELNGIFGGTFSLLLQTLMNIQIFLYLKKCKNKNMAIKSEKTFFKKPLRKIKSTNPQLNEYMNQKKKKKRDDDFISSSFNFRALIQKYKSKLSLNNMILSKNASFGDSVKKNHVNKRLNSIDAFQTKKNRRAQKSLKKNIKKREGYKSVSKCSSPVKQRENNIRHLTKGSACSTSPQKFRQYLLSLNEANPNNSGSFEKDCCNNSFVAEIHNNVFRPLNKRRNSVKCAESSKMGLLKNKQTNFLVLDHMLIKKLTRVKSCGNIYFDIEENKKNAKEISVGSSMMLCGNNNQNENMSGLSDSGSSYEYELNGSDSKFFSNFSGSSKSINSCNGEILQSNIIGENDQIFSRNISGIKKKQKDSQNNMISNFNSNNKLSKFSSATSTKSIHDKNKNETNNIKTNIFGSLFQKSKNTISGESNNSHSSNISIISKEDRNNSKSKGSNNQMDDYENIFVTGDSNESGDSSQMSDEEEEENEDEEMAKIDKLTNPKNIFVKLLYYDPETQKMINDDQITSIYEELVQNIDEKILDLSFEKKKGNICDECDEDSFILKKPNLNTHNESTFTLKLKENQNKKGNNETNNILILNKKDNENDKTNNDIQKAKKSKFETANHNNDSELPVCKVTKKINISDFKLILPLAKGGYGSVGLYRKTKTGDNYAIKIVHINAMKEKKLSNTLKTEQTILKEIDNDYVVNSYYIFKDDKNYYFVMEYLPGGDVYKLLQSIILPESTIQLIIAEAILAVIYLHRIKIIHHDIKPENILITKTGHFKLSDFGLSKSLEGKGEKEKEKETIGKYVKNFTDYVDFNKETVSLDDDADDNQAVGTLHYMAPELFTDEYPKGIGIDYWAIGVVIYELYTFKVPFEAESQEKTIKNIIDVKINWEPLMSDEVKKNYKNVDDAIDLIKKFLVKNPNNRWDDKNLAEIKKHKFFSNFNWDNINSIRSIPVIQHLKKVVDETNKKIKELNKSKNINEKKEDFPLVINLQKNEEEFHFTERIDNLNKRNNELIRINIKNKVIKIEDNKLIGSGILDLE